MFKSSWPGQMRTVYGDHERFIETYFLNMMVFTLLAMVVKKMRMVLLDYRKSLTM
ncbi:MAG: hypothetical protein CM15mP109_10710 [Candidatus Dadabacteria bacterium]|nr:MAG: hypothetical protein CM15mP109_10710 [Candidatus Dadabacteria bacterium]